MHGLCGHQCHVSFSILSQTAYLATLYIMLVLGIVLFLLRYANRSLFRWHTWVNIFVSYYCAIGILVLIPLDLAVTKLQREARTVESYDLLSIYSNSLFFLYGCLFWPAQVVAGVLLYFFEEYNESGYFTVPNRILDALRNIGRFLLFCLLVGGVGFGILLGRGYVSDEKALLVTVVTVNNTYGLIAIIFLLGYGLVELPKLLWMDGNLQGRLRRLQGRAAHAFLAHADAALDMSEAVAHVLATRTALEQQVAASATRAPEQGKGVIFFRSVVLAPANTGAVPAGLSPAMAVDDRDLLEKCLPQLMNDCLLHEFNSALGGIVASDPTTGRITRDSLAALRKLVKRRQARYVMCQSRVERLKREIFALEDVVAAKHREGRTFRIPYAQGGESTVVSFMCQCYLRPVAGRCLSLLVILLCAAVSLAQVGVMAGQSSPVALLARGNHDAGVPPSTLIVLNLLSLAFIAYVILFSLSQLRVADVMEIAPGRKTSPKSLSCHARLSCKLAPPLAYNFLTLCFESGVEKGIWMQSSLTGEVVMTAFGRFYGSMDIIPFVGNNFNRIVPLFVLFFAGLQFFNVFNRLLSLLHLSGLLFGDPPVSDGDMQAGLIKLRKHREQMHARVAREARMPPKRQPGAHRAGKVTPTPYGGKGEAKEGGPKGGRRKGQGEVGRWDGSQGPPTEREGWMHIRTDQAWRPGYFVLGKRGSDAWLVEYPTQERSKQVIALEVRDVVRISQQVEREQGKRLNASLLIIETERGVWKLRCRSEESAIEWRETLSQWREWTLQRPRSPTSPPWPAPLCRDDPICPGMPKDRTERNEIARASLLPPDAPSSSSCPTSPPSPVTLVGRFIWQARAMGGLAVSGTERGLKS